MTVLVLLTNKIVDTNQLLEHVDQMSFNVLHQALRIITLVLFVFHLHGNVMDTLTVKMVQMSHQHVLK